MLTDLKCLSLVFLSLEAFALAPLLLLDLEQKGTFFVVGAILVRLGFPLSEGWSLNPVLDCLLQYPRLVIRPLEFPDSGSSLSEFGFSISSVQQRATTTHQINLVYVQCMFE